MKNISIKNDEVIIDADEPIKYNPNGTDIGEWEAYGNLEIGTQIRVYYVGDFRKDDVEVWQREKQEYKKVEQFNKNDFL